MDSAPAPEKKETKQVSVDLLKDVKNLLDVAITRGVLRPAELTPVGRVYDALVEALKD